MLMVNMDLQNIHGYGIVGINVIGNSIFMRITIFSTKKRSSKLEAASIGGLDLLYFNNTTHYSNHITVENILIMNFSLCGITGIQSKTSKVSASTDAYNSSPIQIGFHQFNFSVNVTLLDANISYISLKSRPLVHVTYNSSVTNYVRIQSSSFTENIVTYGSIIDILIIATHDQNPQKSEAYFKLHHVSLNSNRAMAICSVNQPNKNLITPVTFKIFSSVFANNKLSKTFFNISLSYSKMMSHVIVFENCHFESNMIFVLRCYGATNLALIGNIFRNNSLEFDEYAILWCDNKTELTFKDTMNLLIMQQILY